MSNAAVSILGWDKANQTTKLGFVCLTCYVTYVTFPTTPGAPYGFIVVGVNDYVCDDGRGEIIGFLDLGARHVHHIFIEINLTM